MERFYIRHISDKECLIAIRDYLGGVVVFYPNFINWWNNKVMPGIDSKKRYVIVAENEQLQLTNEQLQLAGEYQALNEEFVQYENQAKKLVNDSISDCNSFMRAALFFFSLFSSCNSFSTLLFAAAYFITIESFTNFLA